MTLYDFRAAAAVRRNARRQLGDDDSLRIDDLLSRSGDDLGLDVDAGGYLVLTEGCDFE